MYSILVYFECYIEDEMWQNIGLNQICHWKWMKRENNKN